MKVQDGQAQMITLDGGDVYLAGKEYGLVPIVQETYAQGNITIDLRSVS